MACRQASLIPAGVDMALISATRSENGDEPGSTLNKKNLIFNPSRIRAEIFVSLEGKIIFLDFVSGQRKTTKQKTLETIFTKI